MLYMSLQACLFGINDWSTDEARKSLKIHNITPIKKVHKTKSFLRYRILPPFLHSVTHRAHADKRRR